MAIVKDLIVMTEEYLAKFDNYLLTFRMSKNTRKTSEQTSSQNSSENSDIDLGYYFKQYFVGANLGHKWLFENKIILEADLLVGKTFSQGSVYNDPIAAETGRIFDMNADIDAWLRVSLGYRLGKK